MIGLAVAYWTLASFRCSDPKAMGDRELFNLHNFEYLISKPAIQFTDNHWRAQAQYPRLAILVHSDPYRQSMRNKIRDTWSTSDPRALVYFALGAVGSIEKQRLLQEEDRIHRDIIQGNFVDSARNLTYKHSMVLKWFKDNAKGVPFLVKIDDDVYPNIPALVRHLEKIPKNVGKYISAPIVYPYKTVREGSDAVPKSELVDSWTITYAFGSHVIYSYDAVEALYKAAKWSPFQRMYDMLFLGYIRFQLNIELTDLRNLTVSEHFGEFVNNKNYWPGNDWLFTGSHVNEDNIEKVASKMKKFILKNGSK